MLHYNIQLVLDQLFAGQDGACHIIGEWLTELHVLRPRWPQAKDG